MTDDTNKTAGGDAKGTAAAGGKNVEGRVLVDTGEHRCNTVITLPSGEAAAAVKAGWLDTGAEAVKAGKAAQKELEALDAYNRAARGEAKDKAKA